MNIKMKLRNCKYFGKKMIRNDLNSISLNVCFHEKKKLTFTTDNHGHTG